MGIRVKQEWKAMCDSSSVAEIMRLILGTESHIDQEKEHFWVLGMNANNTIKYIDLVSLGVLDSTMTHPREVFRLAVMKGVAKIIMVHNHPSGESKPSPEDMAILTRLSEAGQILGIKVLDSIIVASDNHWSAADCGMV